MGERLRRGNRKTIHSVFPIFDWLMDGKWFNAGYVTMSLPYTQTNSALSSSCSSLINQLSLSDLTGLLSEKRHGMVTFTFALSQPCPFPIYGCSCSCGSPPPGLLRKSWMIESFCYSRPTVHSSCCHTGYLSGPEPSGAYLGKVELGYWILCQKRRLWSG